MKTGKKTMKMDTPSPISIILITDRHILVCMHRSTIRLFKTSILHNIQVIIMVAMVTIYILLIVWENDENCLSASHFYTTHHRQ